MNSQIFDGVEYVLFIIHSVSMGDTKEIELFFIKKSTFEYKNISRIGLINIIKNSVNHPPIVGISIIIHSKVGGINIKTTVFGDTRATDVEEVMNKRANLNNYVFSKTQFPPPLEHYH